MTPRGKHLAHNLEAEFRYYVEHQADLAQQYAGKFLVIKNQSVIGVYDDDVEAVQETTRTHEMGTFLVQECSVDQESVNLVCHSRMQPLSAQNQF